MPEVKIVGRGVDTLVLDVCYTNDRFQPVKRELNKLQHMARLSEAPIPTRWAFKGVVLFMQEKGARGCLSRVIAQVRLSSEYLWSCAYLAEAIVEVGMFLYGLFGDFLWFQVSEVDLCADVVGRDVSAMDWQEGFVSRAVSDDSLPGHDLAAPGGPDVVQRRWKQIG